MRNLNKIKDFKGFELLMERSSDIKWGCLMLYFDISRYDFYKLIEDEIDSDDIYTKYGIENEPHITILYGFKRDPKGEDIAQYTINSDKINIEWGDLSLFENEYDVLKISVDSIELNEMNKIIRENFDYHSDYPDYKPHLTIGYLNKDKGKKYLSESFKKKILKLLEKSDKYYVYSSKEGVKTLFR